MPPKVQFAKADILRAAFAIVRRQGFEALNARAVAKEIGCSTQPIFRVFHSMDEVKHEMLRMAMDAYSMYISKSASLAPAPYLGSGLAYILFAREEPALFKLLFMRDRVSDGTMDESNDITLDYVIGLVMKNTGLTKEEALRFHRHLWIYVHGLASMIATRFLTLSDAEVQGLLSDEYKAIRGLYGLAPPPPLAPTD